jgi:uncharacterized protein (TIGR02145 family)
MKATILLTLMIMASVDTHAQNYQIGFTGTGASTTVDSVKVENLSQCISLSLAGSDVLHLSGTVGITEFGNRPNNSVLVYPNPLSGYCSVEFELGSNNHVILGLSDMLGKEVLQQYKYLPGGSQAFQLDGIPRGIYVLKIYTDHYRYTAKLVSIASAKGNPVLTSATSVLGKGTRTNAMRASGLTDIRDAKSVIDMKFNAGDTLKLTGKSGNCRTIRMLFPIQSQTVTFQFVKCIDADSNNYAVVQIGAQLWMEENLRTTRYRDGSSIPNVQDSATWGSQTTGAWCDFHNDPAEGAYYGHLYNYYAVADSRNLSPVGWHVATQTEWNIMEKFIDNTVDTTALGGTGNFIGRILKEGCNTRWLYFDSTAGWNSAGFTALCANFRNSTGAWSLAPDNNHDDSFWTATPYSATMAWNKSFRWCTCDIFNIFNYKRAGSSVRCIKDN